MLFMCLGLYAPEYRIGRSNADNANSADILEGGEYSRHEVSMNHGEALEVLRNEFNDFGKKDITHLEFIYFSEKSLMPQKVFVRV